MAGHPGMLMTSRQRSRYAYDLKASACEGRELCCGSTQKYTTYDIWLLPNSYCQRPSYLCACACARARASEQACVVGGGGGGACVNLMASSKGSLLRFISKSRIYDIAAKFMQPDAIIPAHTRTHARTHTSNTHIKHTHTNTSNTQQIRTHTHTHINTPSHTKHLHAHTRTQLKTDAHALKKKTQIMKGG